jgi:hypothetical protein
MAATCMQNEEKQNIKAGTEREVSNGAKRPWTTKGKVERPNSSTRVYPKVSGLAAWSENSKWYSSVLLGAVVSLFCKSV